MRLSPPLVGFLATVTMAGLMSGRTQWPTTVRPGTNLLPPPTDTPPPPPASTPPQKQAAVSTCGETLKKCLRFTVAVISKEGRDPGETFRVSRLGETCKLGLLLTWSHFQWFVISSYNASDDGFPILKEFLMETFSSLSFVHEEQIRSSGSESWKNRLRSLIKQKTWDRLLHHTRETGWILRRCIADAATSFFLQHHSSSLHKKVHKPFTAYFRPSWGNICTPPLPFGRPKSLS
jgi:hypothetical protein